MILSNLILKKKFFVATKITIKSITSKILGEKYIHTHTHTFYLFIFLFLVANLSRDSI